MTQQGKYIFTNYSSVVNRIENDVGFAPSIER